MHAVHEEVNRSGSSRYKIQNGQNNEKVISKNTIAEAELQPYKRYRPGTHDPINLKFHWQHGQRHEIFARVEREVLKICSMPASSLAEQGTD